MMPITPVPRTPDFIKGLFNLRGKVIPVIDLRVKFGMEDVAFTERTCIIIVEIAGKAGSILAGIAVDTVAAVLRIDDADLAEPPAFGAETTMDYILGLAKVNGRVKILIDVDRVISQQASDP